jgi:hypothetical protein
MSDPVPLHLRLSIKVIAIILITLPAFAGNVRGFGDGTISVKPYVDLPSYKLTISPKVATTGSKEILQPNIDERVGVDVSTSIIGIGYSTHVPTPESQRTLKGETKYDDYRLSLVFPNLFFALNAQRYTGLFVENSSAIDPTTGGSNPFIQYPDLELTNVSLDFTYTFSPEDFSLKAAWDQTVRQTETGGSWLAGMYLGDTRFKNNGPILASQIKGNFGSEQDIQQGRFTSVILRGGYGQTFVFANNWFISLTGLFGYGPTFGKTSDGTQDRELSATGILGDVLISLGYNGDSFFAGFFANGNTTSYQTASLKLESEVALARVYLGVRF